MLGSAASFRRREIDDACTRDGGSSGPAVGRNGRYAGACAIPEPSDQNPGLDPARWRAAVEPLRVGPWVDPGPTLRLLLPWLVVSRALHALQPQGAALPATLVVMLVVALGLVFVPGKAVLPAEVVAMGLALFLAWPQIGRAHV